MTTAVAEWDNEYARLARAASQMRTAGLTTQASDAQSLQQGLQRLEDQLNDGSLLPASLPPTEIQRRKRLIQHLRQQQSPSPAGGVALASSSSVSSTGYQPPALSTATGGQPSQMALAMRRQDEMIDDLAVGVGRLKTQTHAISDEARMHVNLLNDMENNLDAAHSGLEGETRRALRLREDTSLWRLQLIVAGLFILLILLILMGLSP